MIKKIVLLLVISTFILSGCSSDKTKTKDTISDEVDKTENEEILDEKKNEESDSKENENDESKEMVSEENVLSFDEAIKLEEEFNARLYQSTVDDYEVEKYSNKEDLIDYISEIANRDLVATYVDYFYRMENDKLLINPTEAAPRIILDKDYSLSTNFDNRFKLVQDSENELYGEYTLTVYFSFRDDKWIIDERNVKFKKD